MAKIKVLIEGYATKTNDGWLASSTTTLIEDKNKKILVDPGINKDLLIERLKAEKLSIDDIDIVFMTHYHPDHIFLAALFEKALIVDGDTRYEKDKEIEFEGNMPGTNIEVIPTPGHASEHCSLIVNTDKGVVVVAADVFWWVDDEEQKVDDAKILIEKEDEIANDMETLLVSRKKVLKIADWIIPGHGKMFKNPSKI